MIYIIWLESGSNVDHHFKSYSIPFKISSSNSGEMVNCEKDVDCEIEVR